MVINQISDISTTIAGAVEEQTATTSEIGGTIAEAAQGTIEISQNITGVSKRRRIPRVTLMTL
jgi:methyl-accepting chemotaxis protein